MDRETNTNDNPALKKLALEIRQLEAKIDPEVEKLRLEISGLRKANQWEARIGRFLPLITPH